MNARTRAILLMIVAMAAFALADALIKYASANVPVAEILLILGVGGVIPFAIMAKMAGQSLFSPLFWAPGVVRRNLAEIVGVGCMMAALAAAPLVQVAAITQAVPVIVTIGAALILKENVGPRRWIAVIVGLVGVLVTLRPDGDIGVGALFALGAAIGLALRDIFTRQVPPEVTLLQLVTWGLAAIVPGSAIYLVMTGSAVVPGAMDTVVLLASVVCSNIAYFAVTASVRMAEVSAVIPFRYSRLLFGTILGVLIFDESVDAFTAAGALIVVGAGLYILRREAGLSRPGESGYEAAKIRTKDRPDERHH